MTQENDAKRPIQNWSTTRYKKETQPHVTPLENEKANQALHSVTTLMQKIQRRKPMVAHHLIRARPNVLTTG